MAVNEALEERLKTMAGLPAVFWPNTNFIPPADGSSYLKVDHIGVRPQRLTHRGGHIHDGIMQVTVVTERHISEVDAEALAEAVRDHFPSDLTLPAGSLSVRITQTPFIASGFPNDGKWRKPVSIYHQHYT